MLLKPGAVRPKAYIFLNGDFVKPSGFWPQEPGPDEVVIAVDGGAKHALDLGWRPQWLIGDLDSLAPEFQKRLAGLGAEIEKYPAEKNEIDFELALNLAQRLGCGRAELLGALGGRWDMTLANLLLPSAGLWNGLELCFRHGEWSFLVLNGPAELTLKGRPGDLISLLPLGSEVADIHLDGCRYPLQGESLKLGLSRGLSNELTAAEAYLSFSSGCLMLMRRARGSLD